MLRHEDVCPNLEALFDARFGQGVEEKAAKGVNREQREPFVAGEGQGVRVAGSGVGGFGFSVLGHWGCVLRSSVGILLKGPEPDTPMNRGGTRSDDAGRVQAEA